MRDTLINFWNMGIQSFLIFGDNCRIFLKDMGYFLKKLMGYGILGPPLPGPHKRSPIESSYTFYDHEIPHLSEIEKQLREGLMSQKECEEAIKEMKNGKTPGTDGLTVEFYKSFGTTLK